MEDVYNKSIVEFVTVALEYCIYLEQCEGKSKTEFAPVMQKVLSLLYLKAAIVIKPVVISETDVPHTVGEAEYNAVATNISKIMGASDSYYGDEQAQSVSENLADIYQDVKDFITNYKKGDQNLSIASLAECLENFESYWGLKLLSCVKALHSVVYNATDDEDGEAVS